MILTGGLCFFADFLTFIAMVGLEHPIEIRKWDGRFEDVGVVRVQRRLGGGTSKRGLLHDRGKKVHHLHNKDNEDITVIAKYPARYVPPSTAACRTPSILTSPTGRKKLNVSQPYAVVCSTHVNPLPKPKSSIS